MQPMSRPDQRAAHYLITDAEYAQILALQNKIFRLRMIIGIAIIAAVSGCATMAVVMWGYKCLP